MKISRATLGWATLMILTAIVLAPNARGDEGMWLFSDPPRTVLKEKYGFEPSDAWLTHLRRSAVRFNNGGSGSFVSPDGLVMTNHHVAADALESLSTAKVNLLESGFLAKTRADELKCHALELNVLAGIEDVTARVNAAVKPGSSAEEARLARQAEMSAIEKESLDKTGLRSDVVTLYNGGLYHLYRLKKYTDVRLVFAPEQSMAFFGGDADNFEYPRYDLDATFLRVYENGKPARTENYLKWSKTPVKEGDLVFVAGHPGRTDRLDTLAHLKFLRDREFPDRLNEIRRREVMLNVFGARSPERARRATNELMYHCNGRKARAGMLAGMQDPSLLGKKAADEEALRRAVAADPTLQSQCGQAWDDVAAAIEAWKPIHRPHRLLELGMAFNSDLFGKARTLVRLAEEKQKPNARRLREYRESNLASLEEDLFSTAPIYRDLETVKLADSLGMFIEQLGAEDPLVQKTLDGKGPTARADELVRGTRLADPAFRRELASGGLAAIEASDDPMIRFARLVDPPAREIRKRFEDTVEEPMRQAYAKIADARFAVAGKTLYPDATFTLRLAFGQVKGYTELGKNVPAWTTFGETFRYAAEHGDRPPFQLPNKWMDHKDRLDPNTPMNFVSTADIIGGNSGSPMVNHQGEVVGLVFDGNAQSLVWDFIYDDAEGRALSVHADALLTAMRQIYDAGRVVDEIENARQ